MALAHPMCFDHKKNHFWRRSVQNLSFSHRTALHLIHVEHVHAVFLLGVHVEVHVTKHLGYDDYDQNYQVTG